MLAGGDALRRRTAFWITLVATPLLFDANLVVAHALGAAVAGALFAIILRARPAPATYGAALLLSCLGGLLRHELLLLLGAGSLVLGVQALRRRSVPDVITAAMLLFGGAFAYLVEPLLVRSAIGGSAGLETSAPTAGSAARDVVVAATRSLFEVNATVATTAGILGLVGCAALVAATAFVASRDEPDHRLASVTGALAVAGSVLFLAQPHLVTGFVWAFPALLLLVAGPFRRTAVDAHLRTGLIVSAVFGVLVAATQYSQGGGLEWGWRYVAVAIPLLTPAIAAVVARLWQDRHSGAPGFALVTVLVACVVIQLGGLRYQRTVLSDTHHFLDRVDQVTEEASAEWVVSTDASFGRFAYELSVDGNVASVANADVGQVLGWLRDDGVSTVLLVWRLDEPPADRSLGGFRRTTRSWDVASGYQGALFERD